LEEGDIRDSKSREAAEGERQKLKEEHQSIVTMMEQKMEAVTQQKQSVEKVVN
jgi:hypothetical protein